MDGYQAAVNDWMKKCFGLVVTCNTIERNHRFLEEAIELVQSNGCTAQEAHALVDYVFARPLGEPVQEVGGVMVTLAALCNTLGISMGKAADRELDRCELNIGNIRAKHARKLRFSPLPGSDA